VRTINSIHIRELVGCLFARSSTMLQKIVLLAFCFTLAFAQPSLKCNENEVLNQCGGCDGTCTNPNPICTFICGPPACRCDAGFVRSENGTCIPQTQCGDARPTRETSNSCPPNEVFTECSTCEGSCENPQPFCTQQCRPPKFQCQNGFVRHGNGTCVQKIACVLVNPAGEVQDARLADSPIIPVNDPCATVRCANGPCKVKSGKAVCTRSTQPTDPCSTIRCAEGTKCVWVQINCFVPPCPQEPPKCEKVTNGQ
jgi:hypothetical protein